MHLRLLVKRRKLEAAWSAEPSTTHPASRPHCASNNDGCLCIPLQACCAPLHLPRQQPRRHRRLAPLSAAVAATAVPPAMASVVWAALKHSAKVIATANAVGFAVTAVTQSHKITDLTGTAGFALSAVATPHRGLQVWGRPLPALHCLHCTALTSSCESAHVA